MDFEDPHFTDERIRDLVARPGPTEEERTHLHDCIDCLRKYLQAHRGGNALHEPEKPSE